MDIKYIPMARGFIYLAVVLDCSPQLHGHALVPEGWRRLPGGRRLVWPVDKTAVLGVGRMSQGLGVALFRAAADMIAARCASVRDVAAVLGDQLLAAAVVDQAGQQSAVADARALAALAWPAHVKR
jgi:hypothetical protein